MYPPYPWNGWGLFDVFFTKISLALPAELTTSPARVPSLLKGWQRNPILLCAPGRLLRQTHEDEGSMSSASLRGYLENSGNEGPHGKGQLLHFVVKDELELEELRFQFSPGTWWCHNGRILLVSQLHLVTPAAPLWFMSKIQVSKFRIASKSDFFAEAYLKHFSFKSSSFPALKSWFVPFLCQSIQALSLKCVFLGPPCV